VNTRPEVHVWTDGACSGNPGPGGWAALLRSGDHERELSGGEAVTTNNRMEMRAAIEALRALRRPARVVLTTDSEYLRLGITQWLATWQARGWRTAGGRAVRNRDLWEELHRALAPHDVLWRWVRGHAGEADNERVDALARAACRAVAIAASRSSSGDAR
jgi:ribonuclease HI